MKQGPGPISEVGRLLCLDAMEPPKVSSDQGAVVGASQASLDRLFITLRSQAAQIAAEREVTKHVFVCDRFGVVRSSFICYGDV